jgi:hypothetical protein
MPAAEGGNMIARISTPQSRRRLAGRLDRLIAIVETASEAMRRGATLEWSGKTWRLSTGRLSADTALMLRKNVNVVGCDAPSPEIPSTYKWRNI